MSGQSSSSEHDNDYLLLAGFGEGRPESARAFVRHFQAPVYSIALAIVGDRSTAEDVTQQTFERAWRRSSSFDPHKGTVRAWISTVARNTALDTLRRHRANPVDPGELITALRSPAQEPEIALIRNESKARLLKAVRELPTDQARALVMAGIYRMTAKEIADREDIPLGTAKTRIRSAMGKLRENLASSEVAHD